MLGFIGGEIDYLATPVIGTRRETAGHVIFCVFHVGLLGAFSKPKIGQGDLLPCFAGKICIFNVG